MSSAEEHWFDRLAAAPHTRRQGLKGALAALGGALTFPLWRPTKALATHGQCHQPCVYQAVTSANQRTRACELNAAATGFLALFTNPLVGTLAVGNSALATLDCSERNLYRAKADQFACLEPFCGSWQADPSVLCPGCTDAGGKCCPAPSAGTPSGYLCCDCCHPSGDGCTPCGN